MTVKYSVISAVYNVSKYLNDYFNSLVNQTIGLEGNIELILVDDGSTDRSAELIKKWQRRYPNSIKYLYKENGGQASARNLGLEHAQGKWVTFIDPDDFVSLDYFEAIDEYYNKKNVFLIANRLVYYYEDESKYEDSHPLRFKFNKKMVSVENIGRNIQLHASSTMFLNRIIKEASICMDDRIKPSFEDAEFVVSYLLQASDCENEVVEFNINSKYFYRKRSDKSSTLDNAKNDVRLYDDVLRFGCLSVLEKAKVKYGFVPDWVQNVVMYHMVWVIRTIINKDQDFYFLDNSKKLKFIDLCEEIYGYIDDINIVRFDIVHAWFFYKIGILNLFKNTQPEFNIFYIEHLDKQRDLMHIRFFHATNDLNYSFRLDGEEVQEVNKKIIGVDFFGENFIYEYRIDLYLPEWKGKFEFSSEYQSTRLSFQGKQYKNQMQLEDVVLPYIKEHTVINQYSGSWLLMDRDTGADDNAEHLYRYLMHNTTVDAYFVLRRTSPDWQRLAEEGFRMIEFGSAEHEAALMGCSKLISSHADHYVFEPIHEKSIKKYCSYHYVFLQHGVIKDDLSGWLNSKHIDIFVTTTTEEYQSIAGEKSNYKFTEFNVKKTGLPRHDALYLKSLMENRTDRKYVLIMPTWRQNLLGGTIGQGSSRVLDPAFYQSEYFEKWNAVLQSKQLQDFATNQDIDMVFFPHMYFQGYLEDWNLPDYIKIHKNSEQSESFQDVLAGASLLITDYSSVAFDFAYLRRPVLYYQFDREEIFGGKHTYKQGYFDYERDGFGQVSTTSDELEQAINEIVDNDFKLSPKYQKRIDSIYDLEPGKNCERVYEEICKLDTPNWFAGVASSGKVDRLEALLSRRRKLGSIGAIDFLIEFEKKNHL